MADLSIEETSLPDLSGKIAVVTGGASGIGYAAAKILASRGAKVHILDLNAPDEKFLDSNSRIHFTACSVTSWSDLCNVFRQIGHLDMVFANAGVSEETDYFQDTFDESGNLQEPTYGVIDVNFRAVVNVIKLSRSIMKKQGTEGSIVITSSATAYAPEQSLPVYSAVKLGLIGLVRSLRSTMIHDGITINAVAPAATITKLLSEDFAAPIIAAGLPVSSAYFVGLALVYSATAKETRQVEAYGKDEDSEMQRDARWNGRVILTLGDHYTELEAPIASLREQWFGKDNTKFTRMQQAATDFR